MGFFLIHALPQKGENALTPRGPQLLLEHVRWGAGAQALVFPSAIPCHTVCWSPQCPWIWVSTVHSQRPVRPTLFVFSFPRWHVWLLRSDVYTQSVLGHNVLGSSSFPLVVERQPPLGLLPMLGRVPNKTEVPKENPIFLVQLDQGE